MFTSFVRFRPVATCGLTRVYYAVCHLRNVFYQISHCLTFVQNEGMVEICIYEIQLKPKLTIPIYLLMSRYLQARVRNFDNRGLISLQASCTGTNQSIIEPKKNILNAAQYIIFS